MSPRPTPSCQSLDSGPTLIQDGLIPPSLTKDICKDLVSKYGHTLSSQVDVNLRGHYSTTTLAELMRTQGSPQPQPPEPLLWKAELADCGCGCQSPVNSGEGEGERNSGVNENGEMVSADPHYPLL